MKLFGWGKSKHIQPQTVIRPVKHSDARGGRHGLDRGPSMGPRMPCKGASTGVRIKQQGLFGVDDNDDDGSYRHEEKDAPVSTEEKLQDTIRFVFSHEHEGLLAIGTFALEQLAAVRDAIDEHQKAVAGGHGQIGDGFASRWGTKRTVPRSSWLTGAQKSTCELPPDDDTSNVDDESGADSQGSIDDEESRAFNQSKALTLDKSRGNRTPNPSGLKPIVLLTALSPELRNVFDRANQLYSAQSHLPTFVPHWTDSVPPPRPLARSDHSDDEESAFFASRFCGLFAAKKKISPNSKRLISAKPRSSGTVLYIDNEPDHHNSKKLTTTVIHQGAKKSIFDFTSNGAIPSLGKLAKIWRSSCTQSPARITPEWNKPCPPPPRPCHEFMGLPCGEVKTAPAPASPPQLQRRSPLRGLPTGACSPEVAEFKRRVAMHQRSNYQARDHHPGESQVDVIGADDHGVDLSNRDTYGQWVKTDSEFVVLEM